MTKGKGVIIMLKNKKKIIISIVAIIIVGIAAVGGYYGVGYNYAKKNENYTEEQAKDLALAQVKGEVIRINKDFDLEDDKLSQSQFEYEIDIKTPDNFLTTVKVSASTGVMEIDRED